MQNSTAGISGSAVFLFGSNYYGLLRVIPVNICVQCLAYGSYGNHCAVGMDNRRCKKGYIPLVAAYNAVAYCKPSFSPSFVIYTFWFSPSHLTSASSASAITRTGTRGSIIHKHWRYCRADYLAVYGNFDIAHNIDVKAYFAGIYAVRLNDSP